MVVQQGSNYWFLFVVRPGDFASRAFVLCLCKDPQTTLKFQVRSNSPRCGVSPARRHERLTSRRGGGEPQGDRQPDARQRARQLVHARHEPWRGVQHAAELQQQVRVFGRPALAANPNPSSQP